MIDQFGYPTKSKKVAVIRAPQVGYDSSAKFAPGQSYALIELPDRQSRQGRLADGVERRQHGSDLRRQGLVVRLFRDRGAGQVCGRGHREGHSIGRFLDRRARLQGCHEACRSAHIFISARGSRRNRNLQARPGRTRRATSAPARIPRRARGTRGGRRTPAKSLIKDLRGGWYDAGDFNKYTSWAARYIIALLHAYEEHPQAFSDDYGIPESGNGIPDILDEVKWGLDWLVRMQNSDGSLLCVQGLASASPPSDAKGDSYYGPPTTSATLMGAAAYAYASKFFASRPEPDLKQYGDDLKKRSTAAWTWATANPNVLYYNNDEFKAAGFKGARGRAAGNERDRSAARAIRGRNLSVRDDRRGAVQTVC